MSANLSQLQRHVIFGESVWCVEHSLLQGTSLEVAKLPLLKFNMKLDVTVQAIF